MVANTRGSTFSLCRRAGWDPGLERYPRLPVLACHGHRPAVAHGVATGFVARDG